MDNEQQNQDNEQKDLNQGENQEQNQETQKKSKEENFDGVVRKLNATQKEIKLKDKTISEITSKLQELQTQIDSKTAEATNSEKSEMAELKKMIEDLKTERQQETFQSKLEKGLDSANIEPKFNKLAKTALQDIATENTLDLNNSVELQEAIKLLTNDYPEFLAKKPKQIGITDGQTSGNQAVLNALEGNAEGYFKLSDSEKKALISKVLKK
jgi:vacuolar-type H+-ATPase subunit I/STV1